MRQPQVPFCNPVRLYETSAWKRMRAYRGSAYGFNRPDIAGTL